MYDTYIYRHKLYVTPITCGMPDSRKVGKIEPKRTGSESNCCGDEGMMKLKTIDGRFVNELLNV